MNNKKYIALMSAVLVIVMSFSIIAYGSDYDMPIIPVVSSSKTSEQPSYDDESSSNDTSGDWETPSAPISDETTTTKKETTTAKISISKCTVSGIKNKVYTGKALTQSPTVKYGKTVLKNGTDYSLSYTSNKNVGTATVTIKGKGTYTGLVKKTFKINPKATTLSKVTSPKKKQIKLTWKKQTTQTTGYQIQYSTSSSFKNAKSVTVSKNKTTSKTIQKLTSKKKYFVRIRTYKTVNKVKYYSSWSKSKSIKVK